MTRKEFELAKKVVDLKKEVTRLQDLVAKFQRGEQSTLFLEGHTG